MALIPGVRLGHVWTIGFAGENPNCDLVIIKARIDSVLSDRRNIKGSIVCGVSGLSGDLALIFAESCLASGIPLRLLLPMPRDRFLRDCGSADTARFQKILNGAVSIEVAGSDESLAAGQYECSLQVVQQCQELLAVWDGQPSADLASTPEIVHFARQIHRPVTSIHSQTGDLNNDAKQPHAEAQENRELDFLNNLPNELVSEKQESPTALAEAWHTKLDLNAARVAPQVRKLAAAPIICTALAAFAAGSANGRPLSGIWIAAGATLGLAASLLPRMLGLGVRQSLWVRVRTAAEVSRSILALWNTPTRYKIVGPEIMPELNGMIRSLDLLQSQSRAINAQRLSEFTEKYIENRLSGQMKYFMRQSTSAASTARQYRIAGTICTVVAVVLSGWNFASHTLFRLDPAVSHASWLGLIAAALFQVATVAGALLIVKDCDRRQRRYLELHDALAEWEAELRAFHTWPPVIEVVSKVERALLVELLEWRSLLQNRKMPRN